MRLMSSARPRVRVVLSVACVVTASLAGGCSSSRTPETTSRQWVGAVPAPIPGNSGQRVAEAYKAEPGDPIKEAPVEPATRRAEPDDPSEPFSPNYGRGKVTPAASPTRSRVANASD
jgi:hypothetical protein